MESSSGASGLLVLGAVALDPRRHGALSTGWPGRRRGSARPVPRRAGDCCTVTRPVAIQRLVRRIRYRAARGGFPIESLCHHACSEWTSSSPQPHHTWSIDHGNLIVVKRGTWLRSSWTVAPPLVRADRSARGLPGQPCQSAITGGALGVPGSTWERAEGIVGRVAQSRVVPLSGVVRRSISTAAWLMSLRLVAVSRVSRSLAPASPFR